MCGMRAAVKKGKITNRTKAVPVMVMGMEIAETKVIDIKVTKLAYCTGHTTSTQIF